jgi:acylphosphatase
MASDSKRLEATVHGLVQGVGYRWYARQMARRLNLSGYVRNRSDRTVEVVAQGRESAAVVERVDSRWLPPSGIFHGFEVRF